MKNQNLPHIQRVKFKKIEKKFSILDTFKKTLAESIIFRWLDFAACIMHTNIPLNLLALEDEDDTLNCLLDIFYVLKIF